MAEAVPHSDDTILMIPGPIEVHKDVLAALAAKPLSHVEPKFIETFQFVLNKTRDIFEAPTAHPFVIAGSGTLGWEFAVANLLEPGQKALVPNSGYFSTRFSDCLKAFGNEVVEIQAPVGNRVPLADIERALTENSDIALIGITHVDTSTGVRNDVKAIAELVRRVSPKTLIAVDGVCSVGGEMLRVDEWGIDMAFTGSQKALGAPPGLMIAVLSQRAVEVSEQRAVKPPAFYVRLDRWLPIMQAYMEGRPSYFATPSVNLICALKVAYEKILAIGVEEYWARHRAQSHRFKACMTKMGLKQVPAESGGRANTLSALYLPEGVDLGSFLNKVRWHGVKLAGGLHADIKTKYFRVGHMGVSVAESKKRGHIEKTVKAIGDALKEHSHHFDESEVQKALAFTST